MSSSRYDAIVIGAGMSGLAAGIRLSQYEKRVVVLEKHSLVGGLNSYYKIAGRRLDSGLHALTNFARPSTGGPSARHGSRGAPLLKLLRQLRIAWEELELSEQSWSEIVFDGRRLEFSNDFGRLESEIEREFPARREAFTRLVRAVDEHDPFRPDSTEISARSKIGAILGEPLLAEMLLEPILFYGGARERDIDWDAFVILFRSIFQEGLARPEGGIKRILDLLVRRLRENGGELRLRSGVSRISIGEHGARGVILDDGSEIEADHVFSSAGAVETRALCGERSDERDAGRLSFFETITVTSKTHAELAHAATMTFFNSGDRFEYRRPETLIDASSGVICCSDNYRTEIAPREGIQRVTVLANHDRWCALGEDEYRAAKVAACDEIHRSASRYAPDPRPFALVSDAFTPRTIRQFTGHAQGAVYGSARKHRDGSSGVANLHLIGTDQGLCGVVGAMLSGITMANRHALLASRGAS
jgi:phytoene dehydrogenase-like protein